MKKIIYAFLILLMLIPIIASCGDKQEEQAPIEGISLSEIANYKIVLPKHATNATKNYVTTLKNHIVAATNIEDMPIVDKSEGGENEILVGDTGADASNALHAELRYRDYGYSASEKTIVLAGYSYEAIKNSIDKFKADIVDKIDTGSGVFMKYGDSISKESYTSENMTVGGISAKGLKVVYSADADEATVNSAVQLAKELSNKTGYGVVVRSSEEYSDSDNILYFGAKETVRGLNIPELGKKDVYFAHNTNTIVCSFDEKNSDIADSKFSSFIKSVKNNNIEIPENRIYNGVGVMSFNIYVGNQAKPDYIKRVTDMIAIYMPDSFGVQEATQVWVDNIAEEFPEYAWVGKPRGGGGPNEYSAVFYRKDKYTVVESGTKWLTQTPDVPSAVPDSSLNRIMTYAVLKDNTSGNEYMHVNTHFDHQSDTARKEQAEYLIKIIDNIGRYDIPTFVTGDFNCEKESEPYNIILDSEYLDSYSEASGAVSAGTFHGYSNFNKIIDFCFVNSNVDVLTYKVCNEKIDGDFASDHHPVFVEALY